MYMIYKNLYFFRALDLFFKYKSDILSNSSLQINVCLKTFRLCVDNGDKYLS